MHKVKHPGLINILRSCADLLSKEKDKEEIFQITEGWTLYGWFADIPFYLSSEVPGLLKRFSLEDKCHLEKLNFENFDFILYQFHLLLARKAVLHKFEWRALGGGSWFELFGTTFKSKKYAKQHQKIFKPLWCTQNMRNVFLDAFCYFHTDRVHREPILRLLYFPWLRVSHSRLFLLLK